MGYDQRIHRDRPGCVLFLVDQSYSMHEAIGGAETSKAAALSDAVNEILNAILLECTKSAREPEPRNYFDIALIGYGGSYGDKRHVASLLGTGPREEIFSSSKLPKLATLSSKARLVPDGAGGYRTQEELSYTWLAPEAYNGTPMGEAFVYVHRLLKRWVKRHKDSFPPVVLNITDGVATDTDINLPGAAARLRGLRTRDGNTLLFNLHLSGGSGDPVWFPSATPAIDDPYARTLYEMSSELPLALVESSPYGGRLQPHARGFVFNGNLPDLAAFMHIGTPIARVAPQ